MFENRTLHTWVFYGLERSLKLSAFQDYFCHKSSVVALKLTPDRCSLGFLSQVTMAGPTGSMQDQAKNTGRSVLEYSDSHFYSQKNAFTAYSFRYCIVNSLQSLEVLYSQEFCHFIFTLVLILQILFKFHGIQESILGLSKLITFYYVQRFKKYKLVKMIKFPLFYTIFRESICILFHLSHSKLLHQKNAESKRRTQRLRRYEASISAGIKRARLHFSP